MLNTIISILVLIVMGVFSSIVFILANIDQIIKEDANMDKNIIEVTPDKDGKIFITLYGTRYQIVVKEQPKTVTKPAKTDK